MIGKILFVAGAATGYVLGTRAGREAYEKIKIRAAALWNSDTVQSGLRETRSRVAEKTPELRKKAEDVLRRGPASGRSASGARPRTTGSATGTPVTGDSAVGHSDSRGSGDSQSAPAGTPGL